MMLYLIVIIELIILFFLSRVVSRFLSHSLFLLFRHQKIAIYLFAFLFFPGVLVHELSHWLMAQLLFVRTGRVEFWPSLHGTELKLGSVAVASSDPFRRALIGVAPFLFGSGLILLLLFFYQNLVLIPEQFRLILVGYGIFEIGNTMFSSRKDMEGTIELTLALGIIIGILYVFGIRFPSEWWVFFSSDAAVAFMQQAAVFIAVPVILDLCVIALFWLLLRVVRH